MFLTQDVIIDKLVVKTIIGAHEWERAISQELHISVRLGVDMSAAMQSDDLKDALDYQKICQNIATWCDEARAHLVEHLASILIEKLKTDAVHAITLDIIKPHAIANAAGVGVRVAWTRA